MKNNQKQEKIMTKRKEEEISCLKEQRDKLRSYRELHFSNTQYQLLSGDRYFDHVPEELYDMWYRRTPLCFSTPLISQEYKNASTKEGLEYWINEEYKLIAELEELFKQWN